ncbi:DUF3592 domain-containing protein [Agromyces sp. NBRC 114283]|uniref:DUF3592 domain-containing protein n=1 Tax=Agromyces sp. NBRC 114283 TaxID=2994521 RepID=UPI0024A43F5E|nr:DUF3592 domain-containing protein [Agromyces sp. NBRC 114283]GLU89621.1 hypothetical protein Agsp01_18760 [Agromyces sp. NBRC 114283]
MSTIDPAAARSERLERQRGSTGAALAAAAFALLLVATSAVIGYSFAGILDTFRLMQLNSVFSNWESQMPDTTFGLPIGIFATIAAWALYAKWNHRFTGDTTRFVGVGPLTLVLLGLAIGLWLGCSAWTAPDQPGTRIDPTFGEHEAWGAGAWIFYAAQWWLPALVGVLAVAAYFAGVAGRRRSAGRTALIERMLVTGRRAPGVVTESTLPSGEASSVLFTLTVKFTDLNGTDRWVKRTVKYRTAEVPPVGAPVTVLYDPANPGDTSRIFLASGPAETAADFRRNEL